MASSVNYKVIDRFSALKAHIDDLDVSKRRSLKNKLNKIATKAEAEARKAMYDKTRTGGIDDPVTYKYRRIGWRKYGLQSYLTRAAQSPEIRKHGITLKQGWYAGTATGKKSFNYIGSTKDFLKLDINIDNSAPHAGMYFNPSSKDGWDIPKGDMHGGRKALLWSYNGRPVFRWIHTKNESKSNWYGKIYHKHGAGQMLNVLTITYAGVEVLDRYSNELKDVIMKNFSEYFIYD